MEIRTRLVNYMKELGDKDLCVAFSGGVDSSVILRAACEAAAANGKKVYAVTFETKLHPKADISLIWIICRRTRMVSPVSVLIVNVWFS